MAALRLLGIVTPVGAVVPDFEGQMYVDTVADLSYVSYGLTNADWQEIGAGGGGGAEYLSPTRISSVDATTMTWDTATHLGHNINLGPSSTGVLTINRDGLTDANYQGNLRLFLRLESSKTGNLTINCPGLSNAASSYYVDNVAGDADIVSSDSLSIPVSLAGHTAIYEIEIGGSDNGQEFFIVRKVYQTGVAPSGGVPDPTAIAVIRSGTNYTWDTQAALTLRYRSVLANDNVNMDQVGMADGSSRRALLNIEACATGTFNLKLDYLGGDQPSHTYVDITGTDTTFSGFTNTVAIPMVTGHEYMIQIEQIQISAGESWVSVTKVMDYS